MNVESLGDFDGKSNRAYPAADVKNFDGYTIPISVAGGRYTFFLIPKGYRAADMMPEWCPTRFP